MDTIDGCMVVVVVLLYGIVVIGCFFLLFLFIFFSLLVHLSNKPDLKEI